MDKLTYCVEHHLACACREARLRALLEDTILSHSTPDNGNYNECEKDPCAWCIEAKDLINPGHPYKVFHSPIIGRTNFIRFVIQKQGGPVLNGGSLVAAGKDVAAVTIDMKSKRCEVAGESLTDDGIPVIWIDGAIALHLKEGLESEHTEVAFPDFKGWEIFSAHVCRYTLRICFVRYEASDDEEEKT